MCLGASRRRPCHALHAKKRHLVLTSGQEHKTLPARVHIYIYLREMLRKVWL